MAIGGRGIMISVDQSRLLLPHAGRNGCMWTKKALTPKNQGYHIASNKKLKMVTESSSLKLISSDVNVRAFVSRLSDPIHSKTFRADPKQRFYKYDYYLWIMQVVMLEFNELLSFASWLAGCRNRPTLD